MLKKTYARYVALFFLLVLISFSILTVVLIELSRRNEQVRQRAEMQSASESTVEVLSTWLETDKTDWNTLLLTRGEELGRLFSRQAKNADCAMFLMDQKGRVLLSSDPGIFAVEKPDADALTSLWESAAAARFVRGDLGGFLKEDSLNCVVLLEKEFRSASQEVVLRQQIAGALILTRGADAESESTAFIVVSTAVTSAIVMLIVAAGLWFFTRKFVKPLRLMSEGAEKYARGDFSYRLPVRGHDEIAALMQALNEMAVSLEKLENNRSDFLANISHDLRTPVTAISGFVQNMIAGVIPEEKRDTYLAVILDETRRLSRLIETLLEMSRLDAGERRFEFASFDLAECARRTLITFEKRITEKKIEVEAEIPDGALFVTGDEGSVRQVLTNLLDNAVKFAPEGGSIRLALARQGQKAVLSVRNSGEGIPAEELPQVFERFYKTDRSRSLDKSGMGLGLYICKSIIKAHGEEIWVTSEPGRYTEFVFTLKADPNK